MLFWQGSTVSVRFSRKTMDSSNSRKRPEIFGILFAVGISVVLHGFVLVKFGLLSSKNGAAQSPPLSVTLMASPVALVPTDVLHAAQVSEAVMPVREIPVAVTKRTALRSPKKRVPEKSVTPPPSTTPVIAASADLETPKADPGAGLPLSFSDRVTTVDIEFETFIGPERHSAGIGHHRFVSNSSGGYALSIKETLPEAGESEGQGWQLDISGMIRKTSLLPAMFRIQGRLPERFMSLAQLPDVGSGLSREGRMPDNIMDRQSLLYYFMLRPPVLTGGVVLLSDGVLYTTYTYRFAGTESVLVSAMGDVTAVKLLLTSSDGPELIELWLLSDRHYLPVKVRHTDRNGETTEQLVTSLEYR